MVGVRERWKSGSEVHMYTIMCSFMNLPMIQYAMKIEMKECAQLIHKLDNLHIHKLENMAYLQSHIIYNEK
jgi:hypothetical protein